MKARLPQGMGGGPQNMQSMLRQAQKMQENIEAKKAELEEKEYVVSSGGGMVEVTANGKHEIKAIGINPEVVDPEDVEMLEDMLLAAINEAMRKIEERRTSERLRFKDFYKVDILDMSNYDCVIDTTSLTVDEVAEKMIEAYEKSEN